MKLSDYVKKILIDVVDCVIYDGGGDGSGLIVCKYSKMNDVIEYIKHSNDFLNWEFSDNYHSDGIVLLHNQESIEIISWDIFLDSPHYHLECFDEVMVVI